MDTKDIKQLDNIIEGIGKKNWGTVFIPHGRS